MEITRVLGKLNDNNKETFGFKSIKYSPSVPELSDFESGLTLMVNNTEFRNINNDFQKKLKNDINEIKTCKKIIVSADKSRNLYKLEKDQYQKLLKEKITKIYKKSTNKKTEKINYTAKQITEKLSIADNVPILEKTEAYITFKVHKSEFPNKIPCRLINPSKSSIGKISKVILNRINEKIISSVAINHWKNTSAVLKWHSKISSKTQCSFIQFDIKSFYPSITRGLINKAIELGKTIVDIPDEDLSIIMQSRKTFLFSKKVPWVK